MATGQISPATKRDIVSAELLRLNGMGITFRRLSELKPWFPCPGGTLSPIAKGKSFPKKWFKHFGIIETRYPKVAIRTDDMDKAVDTILKYIDGRKIPKLVRLLKKGRRSDHGNL